MRHAVVFPGRSESCCLFHSSLGMEVRAVLDSSACPQEVGVSFSVRV